MSVISLNWLVRVPGSLGGQGRFIHEYDLDMVYGHLFETDFKKNG